MLYSFILLVFVSQILSYITYDTGLSLDFDEFIGSGFFCNNGFTKTATINFSG